MGPLAGPYVVIVFAALVGSLWPLSAATTDTRREGGWLVVRVTTLAVFLTAAISKFLASQYGIAPADSMGPVALLIGIMGNGWRSIFAAISQGIASRAAGFIRVIPKAESSGTEK